MVDAASFANRGASRLVMFAGGGRGMGPGRPDGRFTVLRQAG
jgi:hypothetical protein